MQTQKSNTPAHYQPPRGSGALSRPASSAPAVAGQRSVARLSEQGGLSAAVRRFMARPDIADHFIVGTNGLSVRVPTRVEERLALFQKLPQPEAAWKLEAILTADLASTASALDVRNAVHAAVRAFPGGSKASPEYAAEMTAILAEEGAIRGWSRSAVAGGMIRFVTASKYLPSVAEAVEAIADEKRAMIEARAVAGKAAEVFVELEGELLMAGLIQIEGEDF